MFVGQPKGFPLGDFNLDDVMLPEGEDFGVPSDDDSIGDEEIETETGFGSVIGAQQPLPIAARWLLATITPSNQLAAVANCDCQVHAVEC